MPQKFRPGINFTKVPNRLIRDPSLDVYEKMVYIYISSFSPSFPSYRKMMHDLKMSMDKLSKCIKKLREMRLIKVYRQGRHNVYETIFIALPDGADKNQLLCLTERNALPDGADLLRSTERNKNNKKEQIKRLVSNSLNRVPRG